MVQLKCYQIIYSLAMAGNHIHTPNYWYKLCNCNSDWDWDKLIYKIHGSGKTFYGCSFECYHDSSCDYFVWYNDDCHYGRFSYSGSRLINSKVEVYAYLKNGISNSLWCKIQKKYYCNGSNLGKLHCLPQRL